MKISKESLIFSVLIEILIVIMCIFEANYIVAVGWALLLLVNGEFLIYLLENKKEK